MVLIYQLSSTQRFLLELVLETPTIFIEKNIQYKAMGIFGFIVYEVPSSIIYLMTAFVRH